VDTNHRNKKARKDLLVFDVPGSIRDGLVADAREQNKSVNDTAIGILAARYRVKHTSSGVPFTLSDNGSHNLSLRGGAKLHRTLDIERAKRSGTLRGLVLETLALHYGLEPPESIGRRPKKEKVT